MHRMKLACIFNSGSISYRKQIRNFLIAVWNVLFIADFLDQPWAAFAADLDQELLVIILKEFWKEDPYELIDMLFFRIPGLTLPWYTLEEVVEYVEGLL
jgi:hypothetical protein